MKYLVSFVCGKKHHVLNYYDDDVYGGVEIHGLFIMSF